MSRAHQPFGAYLLLEKIGRGGMAEVWRARRRSLEEPSFVAVKKLLPAVAEDEELLGMFLEEARITVQLAHPNIARVFDLGRVGEDYYLALEYLAGRDLRAMLARADGRGHHLPPRLLAHVVQQLCEGLDYAHRRRSADGTPLGIVHRDVSHENCLVTYDGEVKLVDFGVAKVAQPVHASHSGVLKGKFGYMSPEQVHCRPLDGRSDVFSAGIVLHEALSRRRLFWSDSDYETLRRVVEGPIPAPSEANPEVPAALDAVVLRALERDRRRRFQSAAELAAALESLLLPHDPTELRGELRALMEELFPEEIARERAVAAELARQVEEAQRAYAWLDMEDSCESLLLSREAELPILAGELIEPPPAEAPTVALAAPNFTARRRWRRFPVHSKVKGRWWDASSREHALEALLVSVSQGGAMVRSAEAIGANSLVELRVPVGRFRRVVVRGCVRWWSHKGGEREVGLEFLEAKPEIADYLARTPAAG